MPKHTGKILTNCAKELTEEKKSIRQSHIGTLCGVNQKYIHLHLVNSIYDDDGKNTFFFLIFLLKINILLPAIDIFVFKQRN